MVEKLRVCYLHPCAKNADDVRRSLFIDDTDIAEGMVWDDESPDYLFATDSIVSNQEYWDKFKRLVKKSAVRVFIGGEAISPDLNVFDYAIVFDKKLSDMDRVTSVPSTVFFKKSMNSDGSDSITASEAAVKLKNGLRFCNFIYSNGAAHPCRDNLFYALSGYKRVESLGHHLNNAGTLIYGRGGGWPELSIRIKSRYKFTIAAENASYEGYTSEKLLTTFRAHSLPIYWGNKFVSEEYNPEAFIDCSKYDSLDDVVQRVKEIDHDDDLWAYMVSRPMQTEAQKQASYERYQHYLDFIRHIFTQPLDDAVRRPLGFWPGNYESWYIERRCIFDDRPLARIRRVITNPSRLVRKLTGKKMRQTDINDFFNE